ncbi:hypothetical protein PTMSG1_10554 [Pyrenophora teres f. maculata]|nr:hypothetical protein PTMSG1_10554 [Pyrenophora teres f. maculata]
MDAPLIPYMTTSLGSLNVIGLGLTFKPIETAGLSGAVTKPTKDDLHSLPALPSFKLDDEPDKHDASCLHFFFAKKRSWH